MSAITQNTALPVRLHDLPEGGAPFSNNFDTDTANTLLRTAGAANRTGVLAAYGGEYYDGRQPF